MNLRPYQQQAVDSVFAQWEDVRSTLIVMPTGCGKSLTFAEIIRRTLPKRCLVIAHREELIFQAQQTIRTVTGINPDIEMADQRANMDGLFGKANIIVATVQTLSSGGNGTGRIRRFDPEEFGVLIVDEMHHGVADSYKRVMDYFKSNENLKILGVTATPSRADEEALGQVCDSVAFDYEISDAMRDGWLVPIESQEISVHDLDFSNVRTTAGDLNGADLARLMEAEGPLHEIADSSIKLIGDKRALGFSASVAHAERTAEIFNRHRPGMATWVSGATPKEARRKIFDDFANGRFQVLFNCAVCTEGYDNPGIEALIMAYPTKSFSRYMQMLGRVTRPLPGVVDGPESDWERRFAISESAKPMATVIDFVGNAGRHKLVSCTDILGGNYSDDVVEAAKEKARITGKPVRIEKELIEQEKAVRARKEAEAAERQRLIGRAKFSVKSVNPFDVLDIQPKRERAWNKGKQLTEKQRALLTKQGIDPDTLEYGHALQLIREIVKRFGTNQCSFKQAKLLKKFGYPTNVSRNEAKTIIDRIAANGWRRPKEEVAA